MSGAVGPVGSFIHNLEYTVSSVLFQSGVWNSAWGDHLCHDHCSCLIVVVVLVLASFLESRSWRGLEQQLGQSAVTKAVVGRRGIAIAYEDEPSG